MCIGGFRKEKFEIVNDPKDAEIIVINTCGFIESAKEEAINTMFEMAEYKKKRCKALIVMGCLVQRYYDELIPALPEVDLFIKIDEYDISAIGFHLGIKQVLIDPYESIPEISIKEFY